MDALDEEAAAGLTKRILVASGLQGWQLGRTRIFLRAGQLAQLEVGHLGSLPTFMEALTA